MISCTDLYPGHAIHMPFREYRMYLCIQYGVYTYGSRERLYDNNMGTWVELGRFSGWTSAKIVLSVLKKV